MIDTRTLLRNAAVSAAQVVVTAVSLFLLYGFLIARVGAQDFGVWAVVGATAGAAGIANLGLASGAVRFVARERARGDAAGVARIIETAVVSVAVAVGLALVAGAPLIGWLLARLIEPAAQVALARAVLPWALAAFWLGAVGAVLQSALDGLQRVDLRGVVVMAGAVAYLLLALWLVPRGGVVGLAQAQLLQAALTAGAAWLLLRRLQPGLPALPLRWSRACFSTMWRYGLSTQVISVSQVLVEPTTKALLSRLGGVAQVAYFEMALRLVVQLRGLAVTAVRSIVPAVSDLEERAPRRVAELYRRTLQPLLALSCAALPPLLLALPVVSVLWLGRVERAFVLYAALLALAWTVNVIASPAYFVNLGTGRLRGNVVSQAAIGVANLVLGCGLGLWFGAAGVVGGCAAAVAGGSALLALGFHRGEGRAAGRLVERETLLLAALAAGGLALGVAAYSRAGDGPRGALGAGVVALGACLAAVLAGLWRHPLRRQLAGWVASLAARAGREPGPAGS